MEQDDRLDQRELAMLWRLEAQDRADRRARLRGGRYLSLFLNVGSDGRSYIFSYKEQDADEDVNVGDSELYMYERPQDAEIEYGRMLAAARHEGRLVDEDADEEVADAAVDGPLTTETGIENERNT